MSKAKEIYGLHGVKMRDFSATDRKELEGNSHFIGYTRTTVFKFDDGSEVELHQISRKRGGKLSPTMTTETFAGGV